MSLATAWGTRDSVCHSSERTSTQKMDMSASTVVQQLVEVAIRASTLKVLRFLACALGGVLYDTVVTRTSSENGHSFLVLWVSWEIFINWTESSAVQASLKSGSKVLGTEANNTKRGSVKNGHNQLLQTCMVIPPPPEVTGAEMTSILLLRKADKQKSLLYFLQVHEESF